MLLLCCFRASQLVLFGSFHAVCNKVFWCRSQLNPQIVRLPVLMRYSLGLTVRNRNQCASNKLLICLSVAGLELLYCYGPVVYILFRVVVQSVSMCDLYYMC
jgi:hypothetical protein